MYEGTNNVHYRSRPSGVRRTVRSSASQISSRSADRVHAGRVYASSYAESSMRGAGNPTDIQQPQSKPQPRSRQAVLAKQSSLEAERPAPGRSTDSRARRPRAASPHPRKGAVRPSNPVKAPKKKSKYIPALDGLRALAVLAVIAYHMSMPWASAGLLGVTVFFVLSGYLITSLLLIELDDTGRINLPQFWLRRIRRLLPAIIFVIFATAALCALFDHSLLTKLREDMWAALCWMANWWYIFHDASYFDSLGAPSPLTHFWSLAIEEQFYLFWPLILFVAHKLGVKRTIMRNLTLIIALLSAVEMGILYDPAADPSRVYYGTDTRAFSLLIGAWLAYVWPSHILGAKDDVQLAPKVKRALDSVGLLALAGLLAMIVFADGFSPFLYRGGLLLASVLTAIIIAVMVHPSSVLGRFAGIRPFVWIGKRSYGIYLWHFPLLLLMNPGNSVAETPWWLLLVQLAVIFAVSAFSYRFIEEPFRKGALGKTLAKIRSGSFNIDHWFRKNRAIASSCTAIALVAVVGLIAVPNTSALEGADLLKDESPKTAGVPMVEAAEAETASAGVPAAEKPKLDILMIGDSVAVRSVPLFESTFPSGAIDAAVSRQLTSGKMVYEDYASKYDVGDVVVFDLGTNGLVMDEQLDELIDAVGSDKHIFFVNTRSTQAWMEKTNAALARAAERYDNVKVIDWYSYSADKKNLFDGDGTHLTDRGARAYIGLIHDVIVAQIPDFESKESASEEQSSNSRSANTTTSTLVQA